MRYTAPHPHPAARDPSSSTARNEIYPRTRATRIPRRAGESGCIRRHRARTEKTTARSSIPQTPKFASRGGFRRAIMNIFRLSADMLHVVSIFLLLLKIKTSHSCAGISFKTQVLYMTVFSTRYLDLFFTIPWHSALTFYNTIMKILFISSSAYTIYLIRNRYKHTYDKVHDNFRIEFLIAPCAVLALIFHLRLTVFEIIWAFSVFLESVAILPQLSLLQQTGEVENITSHYIFCLGGYRALYIVNWIWRYFTEHRKNQWLAWACGTVQTLLYADFFYYYYLSRKDGKKLRLPP